MDSVEIRAGRQILLIELYGHVEVMHMVLQQILANKAIPSLITTQEIRDQLQSFEAYAQIPWISLEENKFSKKEIKIIEDQSQKVDETWILTMEGQYDFWNKINFQSPIHQLIHNINYATGHQKLDFVKLFSPRYLYHTLKNASEYSSKKKWLQKVNQYLFPSQNMRHYFISEKYGTIENSKFLSLRAAEITPKTRQKNDPIIIGILGSIQSDNRDYQPILDLLATIPTEYLEKNNIAFHFLGSPRGRSGKHIAQQIYHHRQKRNIKILLPTAPLSYTTYEAQLATLDIAIIPAKNQIHFAGFTETLELTTSLGSMTDASRLSIPVLLPSSIDRYTHPIRQVHTYEDGGTLLERVVGVGGGIVG